MQNPGSDAGVFVLEDVVDFRRECGTTSFVVPGRASWRGPGIHSSKCSWRAQRTQSAMDRSLPADFDLARGSMDSGLARFARAPEMTEECTQQRCRGFCLEDVIDLLPSAAVTSFVIPGRASWRGPGIHSSNCPWPITSTFSQATNTERYISA
jgi:hypothetical protein